MEERVIGVVLRYLCPWTQLPRSRLYVIDGYLPSDFTVRREPLSLLTIQKHPQHGTSSTHLPAQDYYVIKSVVDFGQRCHILVIGGEGRIHSVEEAEILVGDLVIINAFVLL